MCHMTTSAHGSRMQKRTAVSGMWRRLGRRIRDRERRFAMMPPARKRVAIARDVVEALAENRIRATMGIYLGRDGFDRRYVGRQLRDSILERTPQCTACAVGAIFTCAVMRHDDFVEGGYIGSADMYDYLGRWFSARQLALIECAFEMTPAFKLGSQRYMTAYQAVEFGRAFPSAKGRMVAIMRNIARNGGTFDPLDRR